MGENTFPEKILKYKPIGTRDVGRPGIWWKDQIWTSELGKGLIALKQCQERRRNRRSVWSLVGNYKRVNARHILSCLSWKVKCSGVMGFHIWFKFVMVWLPHYIASFSSVSP
jgi:hypothetical protein